MYTISEAYNLVIAIRKVYVKDRQTHHTHSHAGTHTCLREKDGMDEMSSAEWQRFMRMWVI